MILVLLLSMALPLSACGALATETNGGATGEQQTDSSADTHSVTGQEGTTGALDAEANSTDTTDVLPSDDTASHSTSSAGGNSSGSSPTGGATSGSNPGSAPTPDSSSGTSSSGSNPTTGGETNDSSSSGQTTPAAKAGTLSSFSATDLNGTARDERIFSSYQLTMINIWATYCGPCLYEMPELGELAGEYRDRGVQIVGIVSDATSDYSIETARQLVSQTGANYMHLTPSEDLYSAILGTVRYVPTTVFVDSAGNVVGQTYVGSRDKAGWAAIIDSLL